MWQRTASEKWIKFKPTFRSRIFRSSIFDPPLLSLHLSAWPRRYYPPFLSSLSFLSLFSFSLFFSLIFKQSTRKPFYSQWKPLWNGPVRSIVGLATSERKERRRSWTRAHASQMETDQAEPLCQEITDDLCPPTSLSLPACYVTEFSFSKEDRYLRTADAYQRMNSTRRTSCSCSP